MIRIAMEKHALEKIGHSCGDSALKCIDCAEQVCPKCFVQCAVGNRCKKCAGRFTSHVLLVNPKILAKLLITTGIMGWGFGYVEPQLPTMGFYGYLIQFGLAYLLGKLAHKAAAYKIGLKVIGTALLGLLIGLALGPQHDTIINAMAVAQQPEDNGAGKNMLSSEIINTAIFVVGVLTPFIRRN